MQKISEAFQQWLVDIRRDFHMHPETAYEEVRTTERIAAILTGLGLEVSRFDDMTGVTGLLRSGSKGRTLALRADIDALNLVELNDVPYKSRTEGKMHACGHDAHATVMLGVAKHLVESGLASTLCGNVKFLFQPAEEGGAGALKMIDRGVLQDPEVDAVMAGHMLPDMEVGRIGVFKGQSHAAADRFRLTVTGEGGHGGRPHQVRDPIIAAAYWITAVQAAAARSIDPLDSAVITVGSIHGGQGSSNVVPREVALAGTTRSIGEGVRERIRERMQAITRGMEAAFEVAGDLVFDDGYPAVINDAGISQLLYDTAADLFGNDRVGYVRASTGAEDFAYFAQAKPAAIIRLGCGRPDRPFSPLHSPYFDIDERILGLGVQLFTAAVVRYLGTKK